MRGSFHTLLVSPLDTFRLCERTQLVPAIQTFYVGLGEVFIDSSEIIRVILTTIKALAHVLFLTPNEGTHVRSR